MNSIILGSKNTTSGFKIIKPHFTGTHKITTFSFLILTLSLLNITFLTGSILGLNTGNINNSNNASALTYSSSTDLSFTFKPTLSISLSSNTINIDNLVPGQAADSEPITISVSTNTAYGYSLFASVGNNTDYNTSDLIHEDSNISSSFQSIATNANLTTLTRDNTWGYSYKSTVEGSNWSTYNGLPLYNTVGENTSTENPAVLIDTKNPADNQSIDFKLAAKASNTQASGTYNNVINFYAIGKPPLIDLATAFAASGAQKTSQGYYRMQDMTSDICNRVEMIHSTIELQDVRDNEIYTVAKLKDNKCWMTKNLNLKGGTEITSELSDVPENYTLPTANGFQSGNRLPASSTSGFNENAKASLYNSAKTSGTDCSSSGCYSYYSWTTATAGSGLSITTNNTDARYSICPKGWKLPSVRRYDFYILTNVYGSGSDFYQNAGPGTIPNFILSGGFFNGFKDGNDYGFYQSSTSLDRTIYKGFYFGRNISRYDLDIYRYRGNSIRCIAN